MLQTFPKHRESPVKSKEVWMLVVRKLYYPQNLFTTFLSEHRWRRHRALSIIVSWLFLHSSRWVKASYMFSCFGLYYFIETECYSVTKSVLLGLHRCHDLCLCLSGVEIRGMCHCIWHIIQFCSCVCVCVYSYLLKPKMVPVIDDKLSDFKASR